MTQCEVWLKKYQEARALLHVSELYPSYTVHDLHDKLDRAAIEGLQDGYKDARCDA